MSINCISCGIDVTKKKGQYFDQKTKSFTDEYTGENPTCSSCFWRERKDRHIPYTHAEKIAAVEFVVPFDGCVSCAEPLPEHEKWDTCGTCRKKVFKDDLSFLIHYGRIYKMHIDNILEELWLSPQ